VSISEVMGKTAKRFNLGNRMPAFCLGGKWREIIGVPVGEHSHPMRLRGKTLILRVDHPSWMQELSFLKPQLLEKIRKALPSPPIDDIRFELGELPAFAAHEETKNHLENRVLNKDEEEFIGRAAEQIHDPEIREAARRAMKKGFRRKR